MFRELLNQRQLLSDYLSNGNTLNNESAQETLALTALAVGEIRGLDRLLNLSWEDEETKG